MRSRKTRRSAWKARRFLIEHSGYAGVKRREMFLDNLSDSLRVDIAQVVVHEDVPESADFLLWDLRKTLLYRIRYSLCCLGKGLQITKRCVIKHFVGCQIAAFPNSVDFGDRIANMLRIDLPVLAHRSTASFSIASRRWGFSSCSGITSGRLPVISARRSVRGSRWRKRS